MTYLSDKTTSRRRVFKFILVIFILSILSFAWVEIRSTLAPAVVPTYVATHSVLNKIVSVPYAIVNYFRSRDSLLLQIKNLESRTEELENQIATLKAENLSLSESVGLNLPDGTKEKVKPYIAMYPIAQDLTKLYSTLLLSKGFKDGVSEDSLVYVRGRQAVCKIAEIHSSTSLCGLLSASGSLVEGVTTETKEGITLIGDGGGNYVAHVPKESDYKIGETVMYKADQTMKLGDIVDIKNDPQDVFVRVYIRGTYNPVTSSMFYVDKQ